ncbi:hypothetical protein PROFUN_02852 [Planoprotostelium fungivorum]|uniref:Eukaryotic translation initiation factor 4E type 2 n=1 Tax=Planoprotostelium fungivorum TaxID=1890364 RepID=A0A2P6NRV1_9EUKA|nr:hypothetical protein PROFUN_02852 [Planoprotostelium fungivorum]
MENSEALKGKGATDRDSEEDRKLFGADRRSKQRGVAEGEHPLFHTWSFWFLRKSQGSRAMETYEKNIKQIGTFNTVEGFWGYYTHMQRPNDLPPGNDYHLFKEGIKPMWEDDANKLGGKWVVRLRKGYASRYWEEFLLAIIGEQFDVGEDLCGVIISIRYQEDIISIWNRDATDEGSRQRIHERMKRILYAIPNLSMDYKAHSASITDYTTYHRASSDGNLFGRPEKGAVRSSQDGFVTSPPSIPSLPASDV